MDSYYQSYLPLSREKRITSPRKKKKPTGLPKHAICRPLLIVPLPPLKNLRGGRNSSKLVWYRCDFCGAYFHTKTSRMKKSEYGFCSKKCQAKFHSERLKGHRISKKTRQKISDTKRGIERITEPKTDDGSTWRDFSSNPKNQLWYKKATELATSYRDTGEWKRKSKEIKKLDNYTCQGCGIERREVGQIGVHHVKKLADWIYEENNPSEYPDEFLVTLCHRCHTHTEAQPDEYKWPISATGNETIAGYPR
ncbi:MAG: hypothetical protein PVJ05_01400 [Candidatus Thorarchaeota archaeon]